MEESPSSSLPEAKEQLDFLSLVIDHDAALSPSAVTSLPPTNTPQRNSTPTSGEAPCSSAKAREKGEEKSIVEPPSGPSRMVTRSQTGAVRRPSYSQSPPDLQPDHAQPRRSIQGDKGSQSVSSGSMDLYDEDELTPGKSSPRCGTDLGSVCPRCGAVLMTVSSRIAHNAAHGQQGAHCRYCKQVFITTHGRNAHQHLHGDARTMDVDDYCECALCGGAFISVMNLELHLLELHGRDALLDPAAFRMGISSGGEGDGGSEGSWALYHCGVCGHKFTYSFNLDCHMVLHARASYCCGVCDASFTSFDPLIAHVRTHRQPAVVAPIIHLSTSGPGRTATHTSTHVSLPPPTFNLPDSTRRTSQPQASLVTQAPHTLGLHKSQTASQIPAGALLSYSGGVAGVPASQTMLSYLLSQPPESRPTPSQPCRRPYFGLKVLHSTMGENRYPVQDDRKNQQSNYYAR